MNDVPKQKISMPTTVIIGCGNHEVVCAECDAIKASQKADGKTGGANVNTCDGCNGDRYFCRTKPCKFSMHCLTPDCIKSKHMFEFKNRSNNNYSDRDNYRGGGNRDGGYSNNYRTDWNKK